MRIGIVCPYALDVPGGVQVHVTDLAQELMRRGHEVGVLAPAGPEMELPAWITSAGNAIPIPYNGSVARLNFGAAPAVRTRRWIEQGNFDLLHIHEPITPSIGMLALQAARGPLVGTFHAAMDHSMVREATAPMVSGLIEKLTARIAVSNEAKKTLQHFHGGDAVVIPNGVYTKPFRTSPKQERFTGSAQAPTIAFLGRIDEPRKGLGVLLKAVPQVLARFPQARFLVAGRGENPQALAHLDATSAAAVTFLGGVSDADKAALLASATCYVAPQTGGESFGIVLVEAMAAGTAVISSDLAAFAAVLENGRLGTMFKNGDSDALAQAIIGVIDDPQTTQAKITAANVAVERYDWSNVTDQILAVYDVAVTTINSRIEAEPGERTMLGALRNLREGESL